LLLLAGLLSACSSAPKIASPEEQAQKLQAVMDKGGYAPASTLDFDSISETWNHDGTELDVLMTAPRQPGKYPLIIYLPSLGENAKAGRLWREAWVKAGYAVFSMQPKAIGQALKELDPKRPGIPGKDNPKDNPDEDIADQDEDTDKNDQHGKSGKSDARSSKSARSSELRYLGHEFFAVDALKNRMEQLYWAYQQLSIRVTMGLPLYAAADLGHIVLAGYDLGAQTVTAVLGEDFMTPLPENRAFKVDAAIVLSPSIDLAEGNVRKRFQKLNLPLLVISGSEDNDPYAISSASVRAAVWEFSPPGDKYLLQLTGNVHALLAGKDLGGRFNVKEGQDKEDDGGWFGGGSSRGRFDQLSQQYGGGGGNGGSGQHSRGQNNPGNNSKTNDNAEQKRQELGYKQVAAVYSSSTAFLDKLLKNDEFAQFWIADKANTWLDRAGILKSR
jgi:hypothetical protein